MLKDRVSQDVQELRGEAASALQLAATFKSSAEVRDLLNYASALEDEAGRLEKGAATAVPPASKHTVGNPGNASSHDEEGAPLIRWMPIT